MTFFSDLKFGLRSLLRAKGLSVTVILTLALGIGANAAIFSVVRGVLLRPLVNRDEDRLIYIRQSARGIGVENMAFSVPEIQDLRSSVKTISTFGDFSTGMLRDEVFDAFGIVGLRRLVPALRDLLHFLFHGTARDGAGALCFRRGLLSRGALQGLAF